MGHTPKPWIIDDSDIGIEKFCSGDRIFIPICTTHVPGLYNTTEAIIEEQYNQKLIASAPELLYSLEELSSEIDAIMCGEHGKDWADHFNPLFEMLERANKAISKAEGR